MTDAKWRIEVMVPAAPMRTSTKPLLIEAAHDETVAAILSGVADCLATQAMQCGEAVIELVRNDERRGCMATSRAMPNEVMATLVECACSFPGVDSETMWASADAVSTDVPYHGKRFWRAG